MNNELKSLEIEITEEQYQNPEIRNLLDRYEDRSELLVGQPKTRKAPRKITFYHHLTLRIEANFAEPGKYELLQKLMTLLNIVAPAVEETPEALAEEIDTNSMTRSYARAYVQQQSEAAQEYVAAKREFNARLSGMGEASSVDDVLRYNEAQLRWNAAEKAYDQFKTELIDRLEVEAE